MERHRLKNLEAEREERYQTGTQNLFLISYSYLPNKYLHIYTNLRQRFYHEHGIKECNLSIVQIIIPSSNFNHRNRI